MIFQPLNLICRAGSLGVKTAFSALFSYDRLGAILKLRNAVGVGGQQKPYYCKVWYAMLFLIKSQPKRYYSWIGGQNTAKNALRNL